MRGFRRQYGQETASKSMSPGFGLSRDATWLAGDSEIVPGLASVTAVMCQDGMSVSRPERRLYP
jgi:hypothetical protein